MLICGAESQLRNINTKSDARYYSLTWISDPTFHRVTQIPLLANRHDPTLDSKVSYLGFAATFWCLTQGFLYTLLWMMNGS